MTIDHGSTISLEYTVRLEDGSEVESNVGGQPLKVTAGARQIIPGLERRLMGLEKGDQRHLVIPATEAYGPVELDAFQEVEPGAIPEDAREVGTTLVATYAGNRTPVRVHEVKKDAIVIDLNHPLAGRDLAVDITILDVE